MSVYGGNVSSFAMRKKKLRQKVQGNWCNRRRYDFKDFLLLIQSFPIVPSEGSHFYKIHVQPGMLILSIKTVLEP